MSESDADVVRLLGLRKAPWREAELALRVACHGGFEDHGSRGTPKDSEPLIIFASSFGGTSGCKDSDGGPLSIPPPPPKHPCKTSAHSHAQTDRGLCGQNGLSLPNLY